MFGNSYVKFGGGAASNNQQKEVWMTTWPMATWTQLPDLLVVKWQATCGSIDVAETGDTLLIVAGGQNGADRQETASVEIFSFLENKWKYGSPLPFVMWQAEGLSFDGSFFLFGGRNETVLERNDRVYRYNPIEDSWTHFLDLPYGNYYMSVAKIPPELSRCPNV